MALFPDYDRYDALGLAALVAQGEVSPLDLWETAIDRIESLDPHYRALSYKAYDYGREAITAGLPPGPFHGVPFLIKDLGLWCEGLPSTMGTRAVGYNFLAPYDNELTKRYKQAGLVIMGSTTSPEFGLSYNTSSALTGQSYNPWHRAMNVGGSSGGAAIAVSSRMIPLAHGSDGGGSLRVPSACCGTFAMKPTRARIPVGPNVGEIWNGLGGNHAISRSVRDNAALMDATAGPELGAPYQVASPEATFLSATSQPPQTLNIAFMTQTYFGDAIAPEQAAAVTKTTQLLTDLGHTVTEANFSLDQGLFTHNLNIIIGVNTYLLMQNLAKLAQLPMEQLPFEPHTQAFGAIGAQCSAAEYALAIQYAHQVTAQLAQFFSTYDCLVTPTIAKYPYPVSDCQTGGDDFNFDRYLGECLPYGAFAALYNVSGNPAMNVPLWWSEDNLPLGIQVGAAFGNERLLYALAAQLEQAKSWSDRRPPTPAIKD